MSNDTDRLEREAELHRSSLDSTFDAIRNRLSVGQIVDELTDYLKEGQGADAVKNLGRQVRDNPLAVGLVGAGLAWLFMGNGTRTGPEDRLRYPGYPEGDAAGSLHRSPSGMQPAAPGSSAPDDAGSGIAARAADAAGTATDAAADAYTGGVEALKDAGRSISDTAGSAWDATVGGMHDASATGADAANSVMEGARAAGRRAYRSGARVQRSIGGLIQDEPLVFGAVALAIGAAVGAMLPATRAEDEWMGESRDRLRDEAYSRGQEGLEAATAVAEKAYGAASHAAGKTEPEIGDDAETVIEKSAEAARSDRDEAKEAPATEGLPR